MPTTPATRLSLPVNVRPPRVWPLSVGLLLVLASACFGEEEVWNIADLAKATPAEVTRFGAPRVRELHGRQAAVFDGSEDGLLVNHNPLAGADAFTIEVLFSPAEDGGAAQRFLHVQDTDGRRALLEIRLNSRGWWLDGFARASADPDDKGLVLIDPTRVRPADRWYWVALRYDGRSLATFVDGTKELEGAMTFVPFGPGKISVGVRQNLVYWFKGAIAEVRFHRSAIAEEKLQRLAERSLRE